jgi:hypothetical protein
MAFLLRRGVGAATEWWCEKILATIKAILQTSLGYEVEMEVEY